VCELVSKGPVETMRLTISVSGTSGVLWVRLSAFRKRSSGVVQGVQKRASAG